MGDPKKPSGCGALVIYTALFRRRARRCSSTGSLPHPVPEREAGKRRTGSADDSSIVIRPVNPVIPAKKPTFKPKAFAPDPQKPARILTGSKPVPVPGNGISGELEAALYDRQKAEGSRKLVRATSGNVMLHGNLGNIRSSNKDTKSVYGLGANRVMGNLVRTQIDMGAKRVMGNTVKNRMDTDAGTGTGAPVVLCRALPKGMDPEELREMGNEEFNNGRYAEALALYDQAIALDPGKASYWSNKSAALTGLGRILEAAAECQEAVRIDSGYCRAHNRLAGLYFRLGEARKAIHHYKLSQSEAETSDIPNAQTLQKYLAKCSEARRTRDWRTMLKESRSAISFGADAAPQVFAWQAEALLKLQKSDEAHAVLNDAPKFDIHASRKIFDAAVNGYILMIQAQVDMAAGRFDEAVKVAQKAVQFDSNNREINSLSRRMQVVASSRSNGNELFKNSKFREACVAYGEGLDHDPHNAILLYNRAASRSKLGQWEKAVDDCNTALKFRPSYVKARMRRAYCNAKLEKWEEAVQDYEALIKEIPEDEEVIKALTEAKSKLQRKRGATVNNMGPS